MPKFEITAESSSTFNLCSKSVTSLEINFFDFLYCFASLVLESLAISAINLLRAIKLSIERFSLIALFF